MEIENHSIYDFITLFFLTCMCLVIIIATAVQIFRHFTRGRHCTKKAMATLTQYADNISSQTGEMQKIAIFTYEHDSYGKREFHRILKPQNKPTAWPEIGYTMEIRYDPSYPEKVFTPNELPEKVMIFVNIVGCIAGVVLLILTYNIYF